MEDHTHKEFYNQKLREAYKEFYNQELKGEINEKGHVDRQRTTVIVDLVNRWSQGRQIRIIDVGCGAGYISNCLRPFGEVTGIDSSDVAIEIGRARFPEVKLLCVDILNDAETQKLGVFDMAIATDVIEHIPRRFHPALASILSRFVKSGGILIVTVPNQLTWRYYWNRPESLKWKQPEENWLLKSELCSLLKNNFECLEISTFNFTVFGQQGIYWVINSWRLNRLAKKLHIDNIFEKYKQWKYGLDIVAVFHRH